VISVGGVVVIGGSGSGLPAGALNGQVIRDVGGVPTWVGPDEVVGGGLSALLAADLLGTTIIADGLGSATATSVAVGALLGAADAAAMRTALAFAPSTLAAQARLVAATRRGPVAAGGWSDTAYVGSVAAPAAGAQPSIVRGSTFVITLYVPSSSAGAGAHLATSADGASRGWLIAEGTGGGAGDLILYSWSDAVAVTLPGVLTTAGWHTNAVSVSVGGVVRYSLDGGAAAAATGTPALTVRDADAVRIGRGIGGGASGGLTALAYLATWASVLADSALVTLSTSPTAGAPTLPSAPAWEWAAAAHLGCGRVTVGATVYAVTGTPYLWMP